MSDNMIAEGLLLLAAQKRAEINARVEKFEKEIREERLTANRIVIEAQNKCTHPTTAPKMILTITLVKFGSKLTAQFAINDFRGNNYE